MPLRDAVSLIRGKKGTRVHLTVLRNTERLPVVIVRDKIDLTEQAAKLRFESREVEGKTYKLAIIELPSFYGDADPSRRQCTDDLEKLLETVRKEEVDGLLLDLSRNGGGLLEHAVKISGFFIRKGEVVGVEDARGQLKHPEGSRRTHPLRGPLVVHTSRVSASASEILAGALKDYKRAVITGDDHTFGKGTVQTVTQLPPGQGALKITTALFFRPGGQSTQNDGVSVDVADPVAADGRRTSASAPALRAAERAHLPLPHQLRQRHRPRRSVEPGGRRGPRRARRSARASAWRRARSSRRSGEQDRGAREKDGVVRLADMLKEREEAETLVAPSDGDDASGRRPRAAGRRRRARTGTPTTTRRREPTEDLTPQVEEA